MCHRPAVYAYAQGSGSCYRDLNVRCARWKTAPNMPSHTQENDDKPRSPRTYVRYLTRLAHGSAPFLSTFMMIHLSAPVFASLGGSSLASQVMVRKKSGRRPTLDACSRRYWEENTTRRPSDTNIWWSSHSLRTLRPALRNDFLRQGPPASSAASSSSQATRLSYSSFRPTTLSTESIPPIPPHPYTPSDPRS